MFQTIVDTSTRLRDDIKFYYSYAGDNLLSEPLQDATSNNDLENAFLISIMTDAKATTDEVAGQEDSLGLRGFWGDSLLGYSTGSKLWLLKNQKLTEQTLSRLESYTKDALKWMLTEKLLTSLDVVATRIQKHIFKVETTAVEASTKRVIRFYYYYNWLTHDLGGTNGIQ